MQKLLRTASSSYTLLRLCRDQTPSLPGLAKICVTHTTQVPVDSKAPNKFCDVKELKLHRSVDYISFSLLELMTHLDSYYRFVIIPQSFSQVFLQTISHFMALFRQNIKIVR